MRKLREPSTVAGCNPQHLINRLTYKKGLPQFSGDCLEWLRFKRAFETSSNLGGFSDTENIARLFEALKGEAKDAVDSLMVTACSAQTIIKTLELRFGNADRITDRIVT